MIFIDVNGDYLNLAHLKENDLAAYNALVKDFQEKTGLTLVYQKGGKITYVKDDKKKAVIAKDKNGNNIGSKTARKELKKLIDNTKHTVSVISDNTDETRTVHVDGKPTNTISFNSLQINQTIDGTSTDLDNTTFGYALSFFHELGHTIYGGKNEDTDYGPTRINSGPNERIPNKIRRELGSNFGQREIYDYIRVGDVKYFPFGQDALKRLEAGLVPYNKYIIVEDLLDILEKEKNKKK